MVRPHILTILILFGLFPSVIAQTETATMLEIHTNTPKWANGCLDLTVERVNASRQAIYIPERNGLLISLATKRIHDDPNKQHEDVWVPIFGLSDIVSFDAHSLAAGARTTDHFCLPATSAVIDRQKKTRRQVPVRGRVQILAGYFPTEADWRAFKAQREQMFAVPQKKWPTVLLRAEEASLEVPLPCPPQPECPADCMTSPLITEGEQTVVPDIYKFYEDWNERGRTLLEELDRSFSGCRK